jgi:hypothetical protein
MLSVRFDRYQVAGSNPASGAIEKAGVFAPAFSIVLMAGLELGDSTTSAGDSRRLGVVSRRAEIYFEHLRAEKDEVRYPAENADVL